MINKMLGLNASFNLIFIYLLFGIYKADIYLHNPRGSNNRLNEKSATRKNDNRAFDSQNNERGGYNVGDSTSQAFKTESEQYQMRYFQSGRNGESILFTEWTDQHGCGGNEDTDPTKQNCVLILQYMCQTSNDYDENNLDRLRDGLVTDTQGYTEMTQDTQADNDARKKNDVKLDRILQETWDSYDSCFYRQRNLNLFTADQNLRQNKKGYSGSIYTRQNPNGDRNGYECPEERDYYPYWHPSQWKDISILTSNTSLCDFYKKESFNVKPKHLCVEFYPEGNKKHWSRWNNEADCIKNNGKWIEFYNYLEKANQFRDERSCNSQSNGNLVYKWALAYDSKDINQKECLVLLPEPICKQAQWTRSNHLGNTREAKPPSFEWKLPYFPSNRVQKCVFRIRYNISSDDFDPFNTDSKSNGRNSPIKNNPQVNINANNQLLKLAINTAQYGRVFQDRSHSFYLLPRPNEIRDDTRVLNLNIRGKRGNIVQVYPAVEYDFVPNNLSLSTKDLLHVQWTGSNTHNNGNPSGDGQAGDDGQGQGGTDRNNLVQINNLNENFPLPFESSTIWNDVDLIGYLNDKNLKDDKNYLKLAKNSDNLSKDLALYISTSSYYECIKTKTCDKSYESLAKIDSDLNTAPASFPGAVLRFKNPNKIYNYMCSRNNNFSNRSQKGTLIIN